MSGATPRRSHRDDVLVRIARRYRLPDRYFAGKMSNDHGRCDTAPEAKEEDRLAEFFTRQQIDRARWHLPHDFLNLPWDEQRKVVDWIKKTVLVGGTDYRSYVIECANRPYALRFPHIVMLIGAGELPQTSRQKVCLNNHDASDLLVAQMTDLVRYKTRILTLVGDHRERRWSQPTAARAVKRLALILGALRTPHAAPLWGAGLAEKELSMALFILPSVWDWYVEWQRQKRGFFSTDDAEVMDFARALARPGSGWLPQRPEMAATLVPVLGLATQDEVAAIRADWEGACRRLWLYARQRRSDLRPLARRHRDSFEPIRPVLLADSPVAEYRRITTEILRRLPCAEREPRAAAETIRGYLMLRFALHLGLRQRNLRELLLRPRGARPTPTTRLEHLRCGELRWVQESARWEVFVPALAFKNVKSSFFNGRPFLMPLPDLENLYDHIAAYLDVHRSILLGDADDPETFFVKAVHGRCRDARLDSNAFYCAFRAMIERYGIYNPYTRRGAIVGLLPHGPHSVRHVLATHVIKQTGCYQTASYAIQNTPETVQTSYARLLPEDKSRIASEVLDAEWR